MEGFSVLAPKPLTDAERATAKAYRDGKCKPPDDEMIVIELDCWRRLKRADTVREGYVVEGKHFIIENEGYLFPPTGEVIRTRRDLSRVAAGMPHGSAMNVWAYPAPGMHLCLRKASADRPHEPARAMIHDPLNEQKDVLERWNDACEANDRLLGFHNRMTAAFNQEFTLTPEAALQWELELALLLERSTGPDFGFARPIQNCGQLRPSIVIKRLGTCPISYIHPAAALISGQTVWTDEHMPDLPPNPRDAAAIAALTADRDLQMARDQARRDNDRWLEEQIAERSRKR